MSVCSQPTIGISNEKFGNAFFKIIAEENSENVIVSPLSTHTVLSMLYTAAAGDTAKSFQTVLILPDAEKTADQYFQILSKISNAKSVTFNAANKIFLGQKFRVSEDVQGILKKKFLSETQNLDFEEQVQAIKSINDWIEKQTNNKIKDLMKPGMVNANTQSIIVNAVYFKGDWLYKFPDVVRQPFYLLNGTSKEVDMMIIQNVEYKFIQNEILKALIVELPYTGEEISMYIFVPEENTGIKHLENNLAGFEFEKNCSNITKYKMNLWLPKFKAEFEISLKSVLDKMGLSIIFSKNADFPKISGGNVKLNVDDVVQKAFIEVNETGTEAAAATVMTMRSARPAPPPMPFVLKADHPFIYTLNFKSANNVPFFYGKIMEP